MIEKMKKTQVQTTMKTIEEMKAIADALPVVKPTKAELKALKEGRKERREGRMIQVA